ncbi:hypothetical protein C5B99_12105 [Pseudoclavibacter sp. Z016]|nr:hypothetical protein C5B99_12105 [Pseudoclavibacter sp. Z016]
MDRRPFKGDSWHGCDQWITQERHAPFQHLPEALTFESLVSADKPARSDLDFHSTLSPHLRKPPGISMDE